MIRNSNGRKSAKIGQNRPFFEKKSQSWPEKIEKIIFFLKSSGESPGVNSGLETCFFGVLGPLF